MGDVLVKTTITGKLKKLDFKFDIELPPNSSLANNPRMPLGLLKLIERDENERNKQSSLLIVFNSFGPLSNSYQCIQCRCLGVSGYFAEQHIGCCFQPAEQGSSAMCWAMCSKIPLSVSISMLSAYNGTGLRMWLRNAQYFQTG